MTIMVTKAVTNIVTRVIGVKPAIRVVVGTVVVLGLLSRAAGEEPAQFLFGMEAAYARVHGYTARFVRQEVVDGELRPREEAFLKFRRPGLIYLRWVAGPPGGRQILFVPAKNHDRVVVRYPGLFTSLAPLLIAPHDPRVLRESRHHG